MSTTVETAIDIRRFHVEIPDDQLADPRRRIAETRWPPKELVADTSQGVQPVMGYGMKHGSGGLDPCFALVIRSRRWPSKC